MQSSRRVLAESNKQGGAWTAFKNKFKSKWMIGDTYEHYVPPRPEFRNRESKYEDQQTINFRFPAPGSQPEAVVPRGYPETEFDISFAKRPNLKLTPSGGITTPETADLEKFPVSSASGIKFLPHHIPQPSWRYDREQLKRMRRFYLETGLHLYGVPHFAKTLGKKVYRPVQQHQTREEWEQVEVIRDIRVPRL